MDGDAYADERDLLAMASEVDIDRELSVRSFLDYAEAAWPIVEPAKPFSPNWHLGIIAEHLEACKAGEIKRLVINQPPGTSKSIFVSVLYPTWMWTEEPGHKFISASYGELPVKRDCLRSRSLMESKWWRERWGHRMHPQKSQWASTHYRNLEGGFRLGATVGGSVTSEHANTQIVDDPLKPLDVSGSLHVSKSALTNCQNWEEQTMSTRWVDIATGVRILIMQRLHEGDPAGRALQDAGYVHLCLPMEYQPTVWSHGCVIKTCKAQHRPNSDPRTEPGELLDPVRKPREAVDVQKKELGARGTAAQHAQLPAPQEGAVFKRSGIRFYKRKDLPKLQRMIQSWDMTFKEAGSSYVVGQCWGQRNADCYLLSQRRGRWGLTDQMAQVKAMSLEFPQSHKKYVEAKANGDAVVDALKSTISGFALVEPEGGKESRANAVEPMFESGNVWLPHPDEAPWIEEYIEELLGFPAVINDDQVDATTQALVKLRRHNLGRLMAAMANAGSMGR